MKGTVEEELDVKFLFEQIGAALGIAEIFGDIATGLHLEGDGTALKGGAQAENALTVGVVESLGEADDGSQTAGDALVVAVEPGISGVLAVGC